MQPLRIGRQLFDWGARTYVMGILNVTLDSFSGDGILSRDQPVIAAVEQARLFLEQGADILDVGGESTRPGSSPIDADQELDRVLPVIAALADSFPGVPISIDTYKAGVAEQALLAGASLVNDVWGLRADPELAGVAGKFNAPVVLMHNRSDPKDVQVRERLGNAYLGAEYEDLMEDVKRELMQSVDIARRAGIDDARIILDPGIGFGKKRQENLALINRVGEIRQLGFPILIGPSRKSFIGYTLDLPPDQRVEGTAAAVVVGIVRGADIVRVHDVREVVRAARMADALTRWE